MRLIARALAGLVAITVTVFAGRAMAEPLLLIEPSHNTVLYAQDIDRLWHPASLTKIMTAYVVFDAIRRGKITLDTKIPCSEAAHKMPPSKLGLPVGAEISLDLALKALIVKSANDVAVMLAEAVGGSHDQFIAMMNATAKRLGMNRTRFVNPNGLPDDGQITTARDLAILSTAVMRDFPEYNHLWAQPSVRVGKRRLRSHNSLLRHFEGADGLKTGFICDSGFNIVATAERDGRRLVAIVLGAVTPKNREIRAASLLEHGFNMYGWKMFFSPPQTLASVPVTNTSDDVASIRNTLPIMTCNAKLARKYHAQRRARIRALRRKRRAKRRGHSANKHKKPPAAASAAAAGPSGTRTQ